MSPSRKVLQENKYLITFKRILLKYLNFLSDTFICSAIFLWCGFCTKHNHQDIQCVNKFILVQYLFTSNPKFVNKAKPCNISYTNFCDSQVCGITSIVVFMWLVNCNTKEFEFQNFENINV